MRESISAVGIYKARYSKNSNAVGICARCSKNFNAVGICVAEMQIPTAGRLQEALEHGTATLAGSGRQRPASDIALAPPPFREARLY